MAKKLTFKIKKAKMYKIIAGIKKLGWYCRLVTNGTLDYEDIIEGASSHTTLHEGEIRLSFDLCIEQIVKGLKKGMIIDMGKLGKIYPSATGKWAENPDDLKLSDLKSKLNFRASDDIEEGVATAKFVWVGDKDTDEDNETPVDPDDIEPLDPSTAVDTSTGSNNSGGDDIPAGNG